MAAAVVDVACCCRAVVAFVALASVVAEAPAAAVVAFPACLNWYTEAWLVLCIRIRLVHMDVT